MSVTQKEQKNVRALKSAKGRRQQGRFVAEGVRLLEEALKWRYFPLRLFYSDHLLGDRGAELVRKFDEAGVDLCLCSSRQMTQMADSQSSQGLLGVFSLPDFNPNESFTNRTRRILLCDNISDPGNLGTLLRSALAFGFKQIVLTGRSTDCFAPKVVRSSAGAIFGLNVVKSGYDELGIMIRKNNVKLIAADPKTSSSIDSLDLEGDRIMVAIGSEAAGLADEILSISNASIRVSHSSEVESLNAAVAGSIIMNDIYNRSL